MRSSVVAALSVLIVVFAQISSSAADRTSPAQDDSAIAATINKLMEDLSRTATETLDAEKTLAPLSKDKDALFFFDSKPYTRGELIHSLKKMYGSLKTMSIEMQHTRVKVLGPNAAVWIAFGKGKSASQTGQSSEEYLTETWVWQRIEGQWQVIHYHESVVSLPNEQKRRSIEKSLSRFAAQLQRKLPTGNDFYAVIEHFLTKNPEVFGSAFAMNPDRGAKEAFYVYRAETGFARRSTPTSYDYSSAQWYATPARTGKTQWSEPYYDIDGAAIYMLTCSIPVYSKEHELIGIVTADLGI